MKDLVIKYEEPENHIIEYHVMFDIKSIKQAKSDFKLNNTSCKVLETKIYQRGQTIRI